MGFSFWSQWYIFNHSVTCLLNLPPSCLVTQSFSYLHVNHVPHTFSTPLPPPPSLVTHLLSHLPLCLSIFSSTPFQPSSPPPPPCLVNQSLSGLALCLSTISSTPYHSPTMFGFLFTQWSHLFRCSFTHSLIHLTIDHHVWLLIHSVIYIFFT